MDLEPYLRRAAAKATPEEFRARVEAHRAAFDGLLDDEALALLVLDELGLNDDAYVRLVDARSRAEASVEVRVSAPPARRTFQRRDGGTGEVTNVAIEDATGRATLVLWDRDGDKAAGLRAGSALRVVHARVKDTKFGLELHASPWTVLEVPGAVSPAKAKLLADVAGEAPPALEGELVRIDPTRTFLKEAGGVGFAATVTLRVDGSDRRLHCYDEAVRAIRAVPLGARVRVTDVAPDGADARTTAATRVERA